MLLCYFVYFIFVKDVGIIGLKVLVMKFMTMDVGFIYLVIEFIWA
jgi:hypothetical protein